MIYVSNLCVKTKTIKEAVSLLCQNGFSNIELSNTSGYKDASSLLDIISQIKEKYKINLLFHGYFLPPEKDFVLNLASLDNEIYQKTLEHLKKSIDISKRFGAKKFGFHAGFLIDIPVSQIGRPIKVTKIFDEAGSIKRFCEGHRSLKTYSDGLELYIENNVFSRANARSFKKNNVFLLTHYGQYKKLKEMTDFKLLLDIGHLKVSCRTLNLDFYAELDKMLDVSDYVHLSENNGYGDQNRLIAKEGCLLKALKQHNLKNKIITLEIRGGIKGIKESARLIGAILR